MCQFGTSATSSCTFEGEGASTPAIQGARFGQAVRTSDYPRPRPGLDGGRTFLMSMGLRF